MHKHLSEKARFEKKSTKSINLSLNEQLSLHGEKIENSLSKKFNRNLIFLLFPIVHIQEIIFAILEHLIIHYMIIEVLKYFQVKTIYLSFVDAGLLVILIIHVLSLFIGAVIHIMHKFRSF